MHKALVTFIAVPMGYEYIYRVSYMVREPSHSSIEVYGGADMEQAKLALTNTINVLQGLNYMIGVKSYLTKKGGLVFSSEANVRIDTTGFKRLSFGENWV